MANIGRLSLGQTGVTSVPAQAMYQAAISNFSGMVAPKSPVKNVFQSNSDPSDTEPETLYTSYTKPMGLGSKLNMLI